MSSSSLSTLDLKEVTKLLSSCISSLMEPIISFLVVLSSVFRLSKLMSACEFDLMLRVGGVLEFDGMIEEDCMLDLVILLRGVFQFDTIRKKEICIIKLSYSHVKILIRVQKYHSNSEVRTEKSLTRSGFEHTKFGLPTTGW